MLQPSILNEQEQEKLDKELLKAIKDKKDLSIIEEIIKKGADVNKADKDGQTPLHYACYNGHTETARALIEKEADVNKANKYGWTPIQ